MIFRVGNRYLNTDYIITGEVIKDLRLETLRLSTAQGDIQFSGNEAEYVRTILDAIHFTDLKELSSRLPKPPPKEEEF